MPGQQPAGQGELHQQRQCVHRQVDTREEGRSSACIVECLAHDAGLLVVQQGAHAHTEHHHDRQPAQQRFTHDQFQAIQHAAAHWLLAGHQLLLAFAQHRPVPQPPDAQQADDQESRRDQHQVGDTHALHQRTGDDRTEEGTDGASRADVTVESTCLRVGKHIGHEAPEHRHREQVEDSDPEKERHAAARHTAIEQYVEAQQGDDEEPIHRRQEHPPREPADQPAVHRLQHQHDHEHAGKQELQDKVLQRNAVAGEPGDQHWREHRFQVRRGSHRLTHRAQHVVATEQAEEVQERPPQRRRLTQCRRQPTQRPLALHRAHAASLARRRRLDSGMAGSGAVKRVR